MKKIFSHANYVVAYETASSQASFIFKTEFYLFFGI